MGGVAYRPAGLQVQIMRSRICSTVPRGMKVMFELVNITGRWRSVVQRCVTRHPAPETQQL